MKVSSREVKVSPEAEEIIVAHNHPSGDPAPSKADFAKSAAKPEAKAAERPAVTPAAK